MNQSSLAARRVPSRRPLKTVCFLLAASASIASAATYYVDPAAGNMSNPGTSASPWSTLEAVFTANKTFAAGDVIYLRNGYHGAPVVKGVNSANVTIRPQSGHTPKVRKLTVSNAARWVIWDLDVSPLNAGATNYDTGTHVDIQSTSDYITLRGCTIKSVPSVAGWTDVEWPARTGTGINIAAPHSYVVDNWIENIKWGVVVGRTATNSTVSFNTIKEFMSDGIRGLASYCKFEYNRVLDCYTIDDNHDDGFQSWTGGYGSVPVGTETIYNVEIRGNTFISCTDPNQPYKATMQGIGLFDGMYENWVIENNLIVTDQWHGIAVYGGTNCRVVNNTVLENPIDYTTNVPWIMVTSHKNGTASTGCIVRNNLASTMNTAASVGTVDHNIATRSYTTYFNNYAGFDFTLNSTSPAIGAGVSTSAPAIDLAQLPRTATYDVGAYEYQTPGGLIPNGTYRVIAKHSGKCMQVQDGGTANGSNVQQWTYDGSLPQKWILIHLGSNQYEIKAAESGRVADVADASTADGANVQIDDWANANNQKWTLTATSGGYYSVKSVHSSKALDVSGVSTADGANIHQWTYVSGNNQQWQFLAP